MDNNKITIGISDILSAETVDPNNIQETPACIDFGEDCFVDISDEGIKACYFYYRELGICPLLNMRN